nr:ADP-ribosylglycohydrolase family protein [Bacilli bacterium]
LLTIAVSKVLINNYPIDYSAESLIKIKKQLIKEFADVWKNNPYAGWGNNFSHWCKEACLNGYAEPYHSCGNGAGMRISPVGWFAKTEDELKMLSNTVTSITHNHPEGLKGAEAIALCVYMALHNCSKENIKNRIASEYYPEVETMKFEELVKNYGFSEICQESVPQAIYCFLISNSFEDAIRNCIGIGGDCDTTGAMAGAIAEAYYKRESLSSLEKFHIDAKMDQQSKAVVSSFYGIFGR